MPAQAWVTLIVGVALTVRQRTVAEKTRPSLAKDYLVPRTHYQRQ